MEVSPYLSAIQSLKGGTMRTKYNQLHLIVTKVLENDDKKKKLLDANTTDLVPSPLIPLLRVLVAMRLKSKQAVLEALKSDDMTIVRLGLNAKWFFKASDNFIDINYFVTNVVPFISLQTRLKLIKKLSRSLKTDPEKANDFFERFVELYGVNQALPLLLACSEDYIYQQILKRRITLPPKYLKYLYFRRPRVAIRYLQLGNENNVNNLDDRKVHKIKLSDYSKILPILITDHSQDFVELFKCLDETSYQKKLGVKRAKVFMKNAVDALSMKPRIFLPILPLKLVSKKLSKVEFDAMFQNLFPTEMENHNFYQLIKYLEYYPKEQVYELFSEKYKAVYGKHLLDYNNLLDNPFVKDILPLNMRIECYKEYIKDKPDRESLLQPKEAIPVLKEKIEKTTSEDMKNLYVSYMIYSCKLYDDKSSLLQVLNYYNEHLKNEPALVLQNFLERLCVQIDLVTLTEEHWYILGQITHRAYIKGDLFVKAGSELELTMYLKVALQFFLKRCKADDAEERDKYYLDMFANIILEGFCEYDLKWQFVPKIVEIEKACLQKFLLAVPKQYPENHTVWNQIDNKLKLASYLISSMNKYNKRAGTETKLSIKYYSWLMHFAQNLLTIREKVTKKLRASYASFENSLRHHDYDLYQNLIDGDAQLIYNVKSDDALVVLKSSPSKILGKLDLYLSACKKNVEKSRAVRRFIASTKWYQDIPIKIVEQCLEEKNEKSSLLILGILLEGKAFGQVIKPYLPKNSKLDLADQNMKMAFKILSSLPCVLSYTNPPLSLDVLTILCEDDYLSLATNIFICIAKRIPLNEVLNFVNHLGNQSCSAKKLALNLLFNVAPNSQTSQFIFQMCKSKQRADLKRVMLKMAFYMFTQSPCEETWQLLKHFINEFTPDDQEMFEVLKDFKAVNVEYIADYIGGIFEKVEFFTDSELGEFQKSKFVRSLLKEIESDILKKLPEDVITDIITKNFFLCPLDFLIDVYLFSDSDKFESRLKLITDILSETFGQLHEPDPKKPRMYPASRRVHDFFSKKLFHQLIKNEDESMNVRFLTGLLEIASIKEDLVTFIELNVYKIYFEESDPIAFGEKCCKNAEELVKLLNSECVINYYGDTMRNVLQPYSCIANKFDGKELDVIDGLKTRDIDLSILIGVKLLNQSHLLDDDERFDNFIKSVKKNGDFLAQTVLNEFLAGTNVIST